MLVARKEWQRREFHYMILLTLLVILLAAIVRPIRTEAALLVLAAGIGVSVRLWKQALSVKVLYLHNIINVFCPVALALVIFGFLQPSLSGCVSILGGIVAADVFSFMRIGRRTPNAVLMNNRQSLARLSICLPVPGRAGLTPIIGAGDLMYYAFLTLTVLEFPDELNPWTGLPLIVLGQLLNIILIVIVERKERYRGFPATLMPGALVIILIMLNLP
ncbi:hypothetical protein [Paenibacillus tengchongensis]|uniref:hypothetical protein n=1 Tax=Paenibacillus tengchongensis TaxID=2608684 RepID=UPI00124F3669|nr:hypothetical protein [Paenibacillus tengchongensis]